MTRYGNEKEKMRSLLDPGPVPEIVEMRLREAYAALPERRPARPARPRLRVLRTALAAAALCVALPVTVLAATGELLPMIEGAIAFFRTDAATTLDSIQNTFEAGDRPAGKAAGGEHRRRRQRAVRRADAGSVGFRVQRHAAAGGPCRRRGIRSR